METQSNMNGSMNSVPPPPNPRNQGASQGLIGTLEYYLVTKAPFQIPANIKEMIVKFGPWLVALVLLGSLPLIFALSGFTITPFFYAYYMAGGWSLRLIFPALTFLLEIIALPGLFGRKMFGWNMVFYAVIVSFVGSVMYGNLIGGLIGLIIGLYVLFQIRSYYN